MIVAFHADPVPAAAAVAQGQPLAARALLGRALTLPAKAQGGLAPGQFFQGLLPQLSHPPLVQHKEVAGIDAAVPLHHKIAAAGAGGGTGTRPLPGQQVDIVVKQPDAHIVPLLPILVPQVKDGAQESAVPLRRKGEGAPSPLLLHGVQTGNELEVAPSQFFQVLIDRLPPPGGRAGDHTQQIHLHLPFLEQSQGPGHRVPGTPALRIHPVSIVEILGPVQGQAHQEPVVPEEPGPVLVDEGAVGLDGVLHRQPRPQVLPLQLHKALEEGQPPDHGFSPLEGEAHPGLGFFHGLADHKRGGILVHQAQVVVLTMLGHILIKTVSASQIAPA